MKEIINILSQVDGGLVLDAATGRGDFIHTLKQNLKSYTQIIGIDASERSVDYAEKVFPENDVEIYRMNLEDIEFEDSYFDTVTISNSLHHIEHIDKVTKELLRVLKPNGLLLITEMYSDGEQSPAQITHILMHHWQASVDRLSGVYHQNTYTREELREFANQLSLKNLDIIDFYVPVDNPSKNCETLVRNCKDTLKRLETMPDSEQLIIVGNTMLTRISEFGCASASRLLITGYNTKRR
ncbi:MAG: class I SAM-dependent methyltransferase [Candidatus Cloacimonetes bacterium]|nr:class I SAM-dependent methyltransferase [Candidatus Cloacimonadota bacterium]